MKNLIFTLLIIAASALHSQAKFCLMPLDTVDEKSKKACIFESGTLEISSVSVIEEFVEEPSKKSVRNNLKPLPNDFSGYKIEIERVFNMPLDENHPILFVYKLVMVERVKDNIYSYLIGEFHSERAAKKYAETLNKPNYKIIRYKNGVRVE